MANQQYFSSNFFFNHFTCFWPKDYQSGSLGKSHQNGNYEKTSKKVILSKDSNLQPLDYQFIALPLELEKMSLPMLSFSYLNLVAYYDVDNNLIVMFWTEFLIFNHFACFWPKCYQRRSLGKTHQSSNYLKTNNEKKLSSHSKHQNTTIKLFSTS